MLPAFDTHSYWQPLREQIEYWWPSQWRHRGPIDTYHQLMWAQNQESWPRVCHAYIEPRDKDFAFRWRYLNAFGTDLAFRWNVPKVHLDQWLLVKMSGMLCLLWLSLEISRAVCSFRATIQLIFRVEQLSRSTTPRKSKRACNHFEGTDKK